MPNIAIVWDFDGTLTPDDSTTKVVEILDPSNKNFWADVKSLRGDQKRPKWEHILASDAPIWMYALSRIAFSQNIPLNEEFFNFVKPHIVLYNNTLSFLRKLKLLESMKKFQDVDLRINFFIITAGLKELVEIVFPKDIITWVWGCMYKVVTSGSDKKPESVPVFCMDETMKTRSLFEISKGSFLNENKHVNHRIQKNDLWAPFENIVYIGDGFSDVPAFSLVRSRGGVGIAVYDPNLPEDTVKKKHKQLRIDKRVDLITAANFEINSDLYKFLNMRCDQICFRYHAEKIL